MRAQSPLYPSPSSHPPPGNSRLPQYAQTDTVNIYLFHGDSGELVLSDLNYPNPTNRAGYITALVNDTWWGDRGQQWTGGNMPYLFYWVVTPGTSSLGDDYYPQATFTAVRKSSPVILSQSAHPYHSQPIVSRK